MRIAIFFILTFIAGAAESQCRILNKDQRVNLGFGIDVNYPLLRSDTIIPDHESATGQAGVGTSLLLDYFISDNFYISPKTEVTFSTFTIEDFNIQNTGQSAGYNLVTLDFMIHTNFRLGTGRTIPYLITGPNFKIPLTKNNSSTPGYYTSHSLALDFGLGLENKTNHFNFSPELRYSYGLLNASSHPLLTDLRFNLISLVLNFKQ